MTAPPQPPSSVPPPKMDRSMDGLREYLFDALDRLRNGKIDAAQAKHVATISMTLIRSVEVQMKFEALKLESKQPGHLPTMPLIPKIKAVS